MQGTNQLGSSNTGGGGVTAPGYEEQFAVLNLPATSDENYGMYRGIAEVQSGPMVVSARR